MNWGFDLFGECPTDGSPVQFKDTNEQIQYFQVSSRENYHLSKSYVESLESEYDERMIQAYINGEFVPLISGPAFYEYERATHLIPLSNDRSMQPFLTWDFNVDPMTVLIGQHNRRIIKIMDEVSIMGSNTRQAARVARDKLAKWGFTGSLEIYGDASGNSRNTATDLTDYKVIKEVFPHGKFLIPTQNIRLKKSYNQVNGMLRDSKGSANVFINRGFCPELDKDMLQVHYKKGTQDIDKSDSLRTHKSDALRYAVAGIRGENQIGYNGRAFA